MAITEPRLLLLATQSCWIIGKARLDQPRISVWPLSTMGVFPLRRFSTRSRSFEVTKAMIVAAIVTEATQIAMAIILFEKVPVGILPSKRTELLVPQSISRNASRGESSPFPSMTMRIIEMRSEKIRPKIASHATKAPCPLFIELSNLYLMRSLKECLRSLTVETSPAAP